jgi:hypothetical protein
MKRLLFLLALPLSAHVGNPDIFYEAAAGPYQLFVTIRPPVVIPGVAELEVRSTSPNVTAMRATPTPMIGEAAKYAPKAEPLTRSKDDQQSFTGSLWLMAAGSWQVRLFVDGSDGTGELSVPVPAIATKMKAMDPMVGVMLFVLMLLLAAGLVAIVGAGAGEGQVEPGLAPGPREKSRARFAMIFTAVLVAAVIWGGNSWWKADASDFSGNIYKPLAMDAQVDDSTGLLHLEIKESGWNLRRKTDDFVPDHNHLMHLYVIRMPEMDRVWHLHPEQEAGSRFVQQLPQMAAGRYRLYADVVHHDGLPETMVADLDVPVAIEGEPLKGDDAEGPTLGAYKLKWIPPVNPLQARKPTLLRFKLVDEDGNPAPDMELYMGMLGHAAIIKKDGTAFAHIHPSGSVPMASLAIAQKSTGHQMGMDMDMGGGSGAIPAEVTFPYGFPTPGAYRMVVQMKSGGKVYTGIFDADVH